ncbi:DNA segregation ATPase FtsK/SpoIIIE or related protein (FtsK) [Fructobacillus tropaeoli]|uniref:cell division protein FtsK n=1 Tax=Fructobacillus tropaeoli TaxID=709323 RepID=UPI002D818900|nr:DNA segregation ATPase FtsK/SpoIIIE or related protein (FtsK) [Fructobacillus tropaeoli]
MYKKIKYQDQYLAKTLLKRSLLFLLVLFLLLSGLALFKGILSFSLMTVFILGFVLVFLEVGLAYSLYYLFKTYSQAHTGRLANYLKKVEYRQLLSLLVVSKGFYDEADGELTYFPKIAVRFNFKTGQFFLVEPVDGHRYMEQFSSGRFDKVVEIALLADKETTEFKKNKMVSTFAFDPIKFRYQLNELKPTKSVVQISKGIPWKFDKNYNAVIAGNVGTGKSYVMFSILGQLLSLTKFVEIIDPKRDDLASLKYIDDLKDHVSTELPEILQTILTYFNEMEERSKKIEKIKATGKVGSYFDFNFAPHFLFFDEYGAFVEMADSLDFQDENYRLYQKAKACLNQVAMKGRSLGFYLIIGMQRPGADSLPTAIRNQLNLRLVMGLPTREIKGMMFPNTDKELHPLSQDLKGWGFIQTGNDEVRSFFAPEIPKDFNLHEYIKAQIVKRKEN